MDFDLHGSSAVVVGGANGIGRAIAAAFAAEGANVAVFDRDTSAPRVAEELAAAHGVRGKGAVVDATDYAAVQAAARELLADWQRCEHVVVAAGVGSGKFGFPFWNLEPADWPRVLEVNILGAVHVAHAFAPYLVEARRGSLLLIGSVAGQIGSQTDPPYSAAKAALIAFAQCAAKDLAPYGVRVNTLCPGMVRTTLNEAVWKSWVERQPAEQRQTYDDWAAEKIQRVTPLGRWQTPEEIAAMAVFLASSQAQSITGQTVNVDGGQVMHW